MFLWQKKSYYKDQKTTDNLGENIYLQYISQSKKNTQIFREWMNLRHYAN